MYHTKRIGIFISHIFGNFQNQLCQGIIDTAQKYGYNTDIFTSMDGENISCYASSEDSILRIPHFEEMSGIVFASDTYLSKELKDSIFHTLQEKCTCPVIEVNQQTASYPAIFLDNNAPVLELTEHLIKVHGKKHICYLGSSKETHFSIQRQNIFCKVMEQHRLSLSPNSIYECDYEVEEIRTAVDFFFSGDSRPDAIICYNDRMALILMQILFERGIRIPEDIAVTGFDNLDEGANITPTLTTVTFPIYELGCETAKQLLSAIEQKPVAPVTTVVSSPLYKSSCGCGTASAGIPLTFQRKQQQQIQALECSIIHDLNMSSSLNGITDIDQGMDLLENFVNYLQCHELYLCLYPDWDIAPDYISDFTNFIDSEAEHPDSLLLKFAYRDGKRLQECSFRQNHILPEYILEQSLYSYIYTPLFFGNHAFGYLAFSFADNQIHYPFSYVSWIMNINNMLQNVCSIKHMGLLSQKLESVYLHDDLTGHYNRKGFREKASAMFQHAQSTSSSVTFFIFDMDGLKYINDTFGHSEGDFAIQVLGQALTQAMEEHTICGRVGGDEFYLIAENSTEESSQKLVEHVEKYLANYNRLHGRPYSINASNGFALWDFGVSVHEEVTLDSLIRIADQNMYEMKRQRKGKRK